MLRAFDFRSYFTFLNRNRLYAAINLFGLGISLMFVVLIADYTLRQFTTDNYHSKSDRIYVIGSEGGLLSAYYLQKYLRERYPEIESTCTVSGSGMASEATQPVEIAQRKYTASILYADSAFFRFFDFELVRGDRSAALATRDNVVLSEEFARKVFGPIDPTGQTVLFSDDGKSYVVSGVIRDIDRSIFPNQDLIMRAERITEINPSNTEQMNNCGAVVTFLLEREGADLHAKIPDMEAWFREIYWPYRGKVLNHVTLTPLREAYFSPLHNVYGFHRGSWSFVLILFAVGAVILAFAVMNYINLTVAQTGFRAKEMAARRLLGASRSEIVSKLILESTLLCAGALLLAFLLAEAVEPYAERLLESNIDVWGDLTPAVAACYAAAIAALGIVAGIVPAMMVSRFKPIDIVRGQFRFRSKMLYGKVLIAVQNVITIALLTASLTIGMQIRHLVSTPLGYNTQDILDIPTDVFDYYAHIRSFREELHRLPCVEAVALSCGTPHDRGNNNTIGYGPDGMVSFQTFIADSVYFRMLGLERLRDNRVADPDNAWYLNQSALRTLGIDESAPNVRMGEDYSRNIEIAGIYRDFTVGSALDGPGSVMLRDIGDFDRWWTAEGFTGDYPWNILVKIRGDRTEAYRAVEQAFRRATGDGVFAGAKYIEEQIEADYAEQRRVLRIVGIFTLVAILVSALGLVAMSAYYIQQKRQEIAVRKVFGSTGNEILARLAGSFMRLVGVAALVAFPIAWYLMGRWLEGYSVRIVLPLWVLLASGLFAAAVAFAAIFWQSSRAAAANPIESIKN